ncbi:DUF488 domain-containing protein [Candidatus Woesearchaeota archaeon]|nr:DUF488 domain-containing protein [Candidatus Woesearchaeota archaeon]
MTLFTQSIYVPSSADTLRISVMSRHTLAPRGIVPDPQITLDSYHLWLQDLAPSDRLVGDWYRQRLPEQQFRTDYLKYLEADSQRSTLDLLIELALTSSRKITLLCVEPKGEFCHRLVLAQRCHELAPQLTVVHL